MRLTKRIRVHGHVQGVWFRDGANREAKLLNIDGWVRNRRDGTVELLVAGDAEAVEAMIARLGDGPPLARVDRLDIEDSDEAVAAGFTVAATI